MIFCIPRTADGQPAPGESIFAGSQCNALVVISHLQVPLGNEVYVGRAEYCQDSRAVMKTPEYRGESLPQESVARKKTEWLDTICVSYPTRRANALKSIY